MESEIKRLAAEILAHEPGPVVRYRVLRDVLGSEPDDPRFSQAKQDLQILWLLSAIRVLFGYYSESSGTGRESYRTQDGACQ